MKNIFKAVFKNNRKVFSLIALLVILSLFLVNCLAPTTGGMYGGGCGGPAAQGWSGAVEQDGIVYFGSMKGSVLALNPSVRGRGLAFPGENEWSYEIKASSSSSSPCGPLCGPSASQNAVIYGTPVVTEELVYVATYSGQVYALAGLSHGSEQAQYVSTQDISLNIDLVANGP